MQARALARAHQNRRMRSESTRARTHTHKSRQAHASRAPRHLRAIALSCEVARHALIAAEKLSRFADNKAGAEPALAAQTASAHLESLRRVNDATAVADACVPLPRPHWHSLARCSRNGICKRRRGDGGSSGHRNVGNHVCSGVVCRQRPCRPACYDMLQVFASNLANCTNTVDCTCPCPLMNASHFQTALSRQALYVALTTDGRRRHGGDWRPASAAELPDHFGAARAAELPCGLHLCSRHLKCKQAEEEAQLSSQNLLAGAPKRHIRFNM